MQLLGNSAAPAGQQISLAGIFYESKFNAEPDFLPL